MAEVATLYLLGIGNLAEPFYWLVIVLTSIPFVLICFLLVRFVSALSFKDVLHLCLYPIGAGVFTGAGVGLVAAAVVGSLDAIGYITNIKFDFSYWGQSAPQGWEQGKALFKAVHRDCLKEESLTFRILAAGLGDEYDRLKPPIDSLSYIRPVITLLYLGVAACFFAAAIKRRKATVFALVILAATLSVGANFVWLKAYIRWLETNSNCSENP